MRKMAQGRDALPAETRRRIHARTARAGGRSRLTPLPDRGGQVPGMAPVGRTRTSTTHGPDAVRTLPARQAGIVMALEPLELMPQPVVDGTLALLEEPAAAVEPIARVVPARRHILIVEDDPHTAGVVRDALELEGEPDWAIEIAGEGQCALESALRMPPDVVLLDVRLPGLDGGEVYRRLRTSQACEHTKVLFISAGTALDLHLRGIDEGVLLRKPFEVPTLLTLVRALLAD